MDTERLMEIALEMAGLDEIPGDSVIYHSGDGIKRALIGIDIKAPEVKLAHDLGYDVAISHHPIGGSAIIRYHEVLLRHVDQMISSGVPAEIALSALADTVESRRILGSMANYDHAPSIARLLDLPYMNIHTPLDEIGRRRMADAVGELGPERSVADLIDHLYTSFGEFCNAMTEIEVRVGREDNEIGRAIVSHGAGTNGGYPVAKAYFDHGFDTVIYIHCRPEDSKRLREEYGDRKNLIVTGHIASDSIGINPYIDRLHQEGLEVTPISGIVLA